MSGRMLGRLMRLAETRAERRRREVVDAAISAGVEAAEVAGETVRLTGRGLMGRWIDDLALREAGRGR